MTIHTKVPTKRVSAGFSGQTPTSGGTAGTPPRCQAGTITLSPTATMWTQKVLTFTQLATTPSTGTYAGGLLKAEFRWDDGQAHQLELKSATATVAVSPSQSAGTWTCMLSDNGSFVVTDLLHPTLKWSFDIRTTVRPR